MKHINSSRCSFQSILLMPVASVFLFTCQGSSAIEKLPPPMSATTFKTASASASATLPQLHGLKPAQIYVFSLAELGIAANATAVVASGGVTAAVIKEGTLRFSTNADIGIDQNGVMKITTGTNSVDLRAQVRSTRPTAIVPYMEPYADGLTRPAPLPFTISGLGPNNELTEKPLKFKIAASQPMDLKNDSNALLIGPDHKKVGLKPYWVFDAADNSFSIDRTAMRQLLGKLPAGSLDVSVNFVSKDGKFAAAYDFIAFKSGATIAGKMVSPDGQAVKVLTGKQILLKGLNADMRKAAVIDANGAFNFSGVIPDTYTLTVNDLEHPNVINKNIVVSATGPKVRAHNVKMIYHVTSSSFW